MKGSLSNLRALIYNNYLLTGGGGERSTLDIGKALEDLGFTITLATSKRLHTTLEEVTRPFGVSKSGAWDYREFSSEEELENYIREERFFIFVNHTYGSFFKNPAPVGIYVVMFPHEAPPEIASRLNSYNFMFCNSAFTRDYVRQMWNPTAEVLVLPPPILETHVEKPPISFAEKERLIINVGRFNIRGHNKCQLDAIQAFVELNSRGVLNTDWRLVVAGHLNDSAENQEYVERCRKAAKGSNIEIRVNVPLGELTSLYRRASYLWQFTGVTSAFGEAPDTCEHLGLVALDCFAYGVIPVVFHRGGINSLIRFGIDGYAFGSVAELSDIMEGAAQSFGSAFHAHQCDEALRRTDEFVYAVFRSRIREVIFEDLSSHEA